MYRIQLDPGPWQQFIKRADNVGLPLAEVTKKYMMESTVYANQLMEAIKQQELQTKMNTMYGAAKTEETPVTPSVTPSITPSVTVTPSVTPSVTYTPSVTPSATVTPSPSQP